jgi:ABC-type branched-subunit amino acid transport system substrate-binding protein
VAVFESFSGPLAAFGPPNLAGCVAAAKVVNDSGGVLGHQLNCQAVNDTGDPADAVPAANRMLTSVSNLVALVGPGGVSPAVVPIFTASKIPMFSIAGNPQYDLNTDPWYYRLVPSDSVTGRVMAYWASKHLGNLPAASVFTSVSAQTVPAPLASEYKKLGGHIIKSVILAPGQSSYRTEAEQVIAAHPKVIFTETDPQTASTFFSELLQLSGSLPPVIGDEADTYEPWVKAVLPVVSHKLNLVAVTQTVPGSSPGYVQFKSALLASGAKLKNPAQYATGPFTIADYDAVIIASLAMNAAHSTDPVKYRPFITSVTGPAQAGATVVHTYAQGVSALQASKTIRYSGAGGLISFNKYHNAATPFGALKLNAAAGSFSSAGTIPLQTLLSIESGA